MKKELYLIKIESKKLEEKSQEELNLLIEKTKKRLLYEPLEKIIPIWFALVQEISMRTIGLKHFETQLLAGLFLHQGKIVEMKTGEGKTLASTLPVSLNALLKKGVHIVTVNDYLAERDKNLMGKLYSGLGLSVGLVKSSSKLFDKQKSYNADITYVTNSELVFDYLRDSSAYTLKELVQRPFNFCIIDEIDSILIDEARTPLILSSFKEDKNRNKLYIAKALAESLKKDIDFQVDEKRKDINLTEEGYEKAKTIVGKKSLYDPLDPWILEILNALKANYLFKLNKDYIVLNNKILIVDEFTGRIMEDRRWSMGIHEAIEMKEKVDIGGGTKTKSSITYQNFFTLYPKLAGMTGTAKTTEKEFQDIYNLEVVVLPTAKPMIRKDLPDLVYQSELAKWKAVVTESKKCFEIGQPILIGTATVEKSEFLSDLFRFSKIPHQVLNAKPENIKRENEIIAQAGEAYAVTIATNMAGRGTDIILGGNPVFKVKQKLNEIFLKKKETEELDFIETLEELLEIKILIAAIFKEYDSSFEKLKEEVEDLPYSLETSKTCLNSLYNYIYKKIYKKWEKNNLFVKKVGGLFVLGTERHETRRIDNQLRGRAGRQGDPGISQFFVSLDDDLIKIFGGDTIRKWVDFLVEDKNTPLESNLLTKSLENAQKKVELYNYDLRKNIFQYDDILNSQRKKLFNTRNQILRKNIYSELFLRGSESILAEYLLKKNKQKGYKFSYKVEQLFSSYSAYGTEIKKITKRKKKIFIFRLYKETWITNDLRFAQLNFYEVNFLKNLRASYILAVLDFYWTEHLERMGYIKETINWRAYGQQNPLLEYNIEAFNSFKLMFEQIRFYILSFLS
jgi:preprotein translocase subunit SecA